MRSNKFKSYLILCVSVLISAVIGYYLDNYFDSILVTLLVTCTLAIILSQLFELSVTQLKNRQEPADQLIYTQETLSAFKNLNEKIKSLNSEAELYILHWTSKQFISLNSGRAFLTKHSLVYAVQEKQQALQLTDKNFFAKLPEVVSLDIQSFLKQENKDAILPLLMGKNIFGIILYRGNHNDLELTKLALQHSQTLGHLVQQNAITNGSLALSSKTVKQDHETVSWQSTAILIYFCLMTIWWLVTPFIRTVNYDRYFFDFGNIYGLVAAWGGVWGIAVAMQYKKQKNLSKAILFIAIGLLLQEFGQLGYAVYYFLWNIQIPYPSVGDIGYFGSALAYIVGVYYLAKSVGINLKLKTFQNQLLAVVVPTLMLMLGYLLFLQHYQFDWSQPVRIFLDFGYPFVQAIYVSIAMLIYLLSRDIEGLVNRQIGLIVIALVWQFICDYTFLYQASKETWQVNGGNDYMYLVSYVLMSVIVLKLLRQNSNIG